jgi:hypothetical protein
MKTANVYALVCIFFSLLTLLLSVSAASQPSVGVKRGDWIQYSITITGSPQLDLARNLSSYLTQILDTSPTSIKVNKTATSVNGTLTSSVWNFSFVDGRVPGWAFIPANLSVGDTFYDFNMTANVKIGGEEQKSLLGAERTVTHANVAGKVYKEWDKATGVYVHAVEFTTNYTITTEVTATNLWSTKTQEQKPLAYAELIAAAVFSTGLILVLAALILRKKLVKKV